MLRAAPTGVTFRRRLSFGSDCAGHCPAPSQNARGGRTPRLPSPSKDWTHGPAGPALCSRAYENSARSDSARPCRDHFGTDGPRSGSHDRSGTDDRCYHGELRRRGRRHHQRHPDLPDRCVSGCRTHAPANPPDTGQLWAAQPRVLAPGSGQSLAHDGTNASAGRCTLPRADRGLCPRPARWHGTAHRPGQRHRAAVGAGTLQGMARVIRHHLQHLVRSARTQQRQDHPCCHQAHGSLC